MATVKTIAWDEGDGNITLTYDGEGTGTVSISSDPNNLPTSRTKTLTFATAGSNPASATLTIVQEPDTSGRMTIAELVADLNSGVSYTEEEIHEVCRNNYGCLIKVAAGKTVSVKFNNSSSYTYTVGDASTTADTWFWQDAGVNYTTLQSALYGQTNLVEVGYLYCPGTVTNLSQVFRGATNVQKINTVGWNTSSVTTFYGLFLQCTKLTDIPGVSAFDVSAADDIQMMFQQCRQLTALDLSSWDVSGIQYMQQMFYYCDKLTAAGVDNWDVSSVKDFSQMFNMCSKLVFDTDLSSWKASPLKVSRMFAGASKVIALDLRGLDVSAVSDFTGVFGSMTSLTSLDITGWDMSNATNLQTMFHYNTGSSLVVDFRTCKAFDTSKVKGTNMNYFISGSGIVELHLGDSFNLQGVTTTKLLFGGYNTYNLTTITGTMSNWGKAFASNTTIDLSYLRALTRDSAMVIVNGLYDLAANGSSLAHTLKLYSSVYALLSADDIAVATGKGWILTSA